MRVALLYEIQGECLQAIEADDWIEARGRWKHAGWCMSLGMDGF